MNRDMIAIQKKVEKTNMERYGVPYSWSSSVVIEKIKQTKLFRYGSRSYNNLPKMEETNLDRYGVKYTCLSSEIKKKINDKHKTNTPELWDKKWLKEQNKTKGASDIARILGVTPRTVYLAFDRLGIEPIFHKPKLRLEKNISDFIQSIENSDLIRNTRRVIKPKELDFWKPLKNWALELNGAFWHSFDSPPNKSEKNKHKTKLELCEEKNIRLLQIWDFEWIGTPEIIKDIIRCSLGVKANTTIQGRKTEIKVLDQKTTNEFLENNHLQGKVSGKYRYGLFHENVLISVMVFGKSRFSSSESYELYRYAQKLDHHVIGGAEKLFKTFIQEIHPKHIISYSDNRLFRGSLYKKLGFRKTGVSPPDYLWYKRGKTVSRYRTQKHKLKNFLGDKFDQTLSEDHNMFRCGYRKLYGCGNSVWFWNKKES